MVVLPGTVLCVENWLPVVGHEGYEVSDLGRVRSVDRVVSQVNRWGKVGERRLKGRILKPGQMKKVNGSPGYLFVALGAGNTRLVHRLVLEAFCGPCPDRIDGSHLNDDPTDNRLENLKWESRRDNQLRAVANKRNQHSNKTHCKNGHEFTPENTLIRQSPDRATWRGCRRCGKDAMARYRAGGV